jgi:hypothetical protein
MKRKLFTALIILSLIILGIAIVAWSNNKKSDTAKISQLTGMEVSAEDAERPILGVMIENSEQSRPQSGLNAAGIVFESVTEGGITRLLALYQEDQPEIVGPVRSLRSHFLDWAMGFDASIAHVGGSPEALDLAKTREAKSLNQFTFSIPYYRDDSRTAPHNMYARTKDLRETQQSEGFERSSFADIPRANEPLPETASAATNINIDFSGPLYIVEYRYDPDKKTYTRYLAGQPHNDAVTSDPISVNNIVVLRVKISDGKVQALGNGEALVFRDGKAIKANWSKEGFDQRINITGSDNTEIELNRGSTWFAALPQDRPLTYK